jgi:hypothetical protein
MAGDMRLAHHDRPDGTRAVEIGGVSLSVATPRAPELVPHVLFYDIPRWVRGICCAEVLLSARKHTFGLNDLAVLAIRMGIENHFSCSRKASCYVCTFRPQMCFFEIENACLEPFLAANCMCCGRS